jgi:transketolase
MTVPATQARPAQRSIDMATDQHRPSHSIETLTIDTIRTLTLDAVEKAQSGHPGTPMGMAPVGYVLWSRFLRYDPDRPDWPNRDRFVL